MHELETNPCSVSCPTCRPEEPGLNHRFSVAPALVLRQRKWNLSTLPPLLVRNNRQNSYWAEFNSAYWCSPLQCLFSVMLQCAHNVQTDRDTRVQCFSLLLALHRFVCEDPKPPPPMFAKGSKSKYEMCAQWWEVNLLSKQLVVHLDSLHLFVTVLQPLVILTQLADVVARFGQDASFTLRNKQII